MKTKKIILSLLVFSAMVNAEQYTPQDKNYRGKHQSNVEVGKDIPDTVRTNRYLYPQIHRDRIEMQTAVNAKAYKDVQAQENNRKKVLSGIFDADISMKPEYRIIQKVDTIKFSPKFITTILLPPGMVVMDAKASFPTNHSTFKNNIIALQPKDFFYSGNIFITYTDGKRNYYMTILAERYFQNRAEVNDYISAVKKSNPSIAKDIEAKYGNLNDYAYATERLSIVYQYMLPTTLSPEDAIMLYERMTHTKGIDIDDGDFVSFLYDGVTYRIIRDDTQGTLIYGKKAYRVENSLESK